MANMGYCRFENTLNDLIDCVRHLDDDIADLSSVERDCRTTLILLCKQVADEYGEEVES
jgi:hypothetical protein